MQAQSPDSLSSDSILQISAFIFIPNVSLEPLFRANIDAPYAPCGVLLGIVMFQRFFFCKKTSAVSPLFIPSSIAIRNELPGQALNQGALRL